MRMKHCSVGIYFRVAATATTFFVLLPTAGKAVSVKNLINPGEVIQGHAKYEEKCELCHEAFDKGSQRLLCLDCHKDLAKDIEQELGFHGRSKEVKSVYCKYCHTDHKGRNMDILSLDKDHFDHTVTDFVLKDAHLKVQCPRCHKLGTKYREAPFKCVDCHGKNDPHKGNLGKACETCHSESSWDKLSSFDHAKTKFPLKGKHKKILCSLCHPDERYEKKTPGKCLDCHVLSDVHRGSYGAECHKCHSADDWKRMTFDHEKTKYPLKGKHVEVKCLACHPGDIKEKLRTDCIGCHKKNDSHKGLYGDKCETCHTENDWKKSIFDHQKTKYELEDKHKEAACVECHIRKISEKKLGAECYGCHKKDDDHKLRYGKKCETCHNLKGWKKPSFDHDKTEYPLKDKHRSVKCDVCHKGPVDPKKKMGSACIGCHKRSDVHNGLYGDKCEDCHNTKGWKELIFDHDKTKFPLKEKHREVKCQGCHTEPTVKTKLPLVCEGCHKDDDVHKGQEGKFCERCHNEQSWREKVFFNHDLTKLPLIGLHAIVPCEECHLTATYKDSPLQCVKCHEKDDVHKKRLSDECSLCHNPNGWGIWVFNHKIQGKLELQNKHKDVECVACHREPVKKKWNTPKKCVGCHRKDDVHRGSFGIFCDRCHGTKSFRQVEMSQ